MQNETGEAAWMTAAHEFSMAELAELSGLSPAELQELVDYGAVTPLDREASPWVFGGQCLLTVRSAYRLRQGFDLEPHGVALAISLLERIRDLEAQLDQLRARLPRPGPVNT